MNRLIELHPHPSRPSRRVSAPVLEAAAAVFRAFGEIERLRLLTMLAGGERCVSELSEELGEGLSTVSQRLRVLRNDALVARRREGKHVWYSLADEHVADLLRTALAHAREHTKASKPSRSGK